MSNFLSTFLLNLLLKASQDERVREFVADQVARLADYLTGDVAELFPAFVDETLGKVLDADPDIKYVSDRIDVSEWIRNLLGR